MAHNVHAKNGSRMYFLIELIGDSCTVRKAVPYKFHIELELE